MNDRLALELDKLTAAIAVLRESMDDDESRKARDSMLLRFVFTFEMAWRSMKFAMAARGLSTPDYAAAVLRAALQAQIIVDATLWDTLREYRNDVSHAYEEAKAIKIAAYVREHALPAFEQILSDLRSGD